MFSNTLQHTQNFAHNNFEYYNSYQQIKLNYKDDFSKLHYACQRQTKTRIIISNYQSIKTQQLINFINLYHNNNDKSSNLLSRKQNYQISYLTNILPQIYQKYTSSIPIIAHSIKLIVQNQANYSRQLLKSLQSNQNDNYESLWRLLQEDNIQWLQAIQIGQSWQQCIEFILQFKFLVQQIMTTTARSLLFLGHFTSLRSILHPLTLPIIYLQQNYPKQKIVLINFQVYENPYNIRFMRHNSHNFFYISFFKQPNSLYTKYITNNMNNFKQFVQVYSQRLIEQAYGQQNISKDNKKIMLFPMNSYFFRLKSQQYGNKYKYKYPPILEHSHIHSIFQNILYNEIKDFHPQLIIVCYNGSLFLSEIHFRDIIRSLTIIVDHKIILFDHNKKNNMNNDLKYDMTNFYDNYIIKQDINYNCYYNNLSTFIKVSSGKWNMKNNQLSIPLINQSLVYLEQLSQNKLMQWLKPYINTSISIFELNQLLFKQNTKQLQLSNNNNINSYNILITTVISEIFQQQQLINYNNNKYIYQNILYLISNIQHLQQKQKQQFWMIKKHKFLIKQLQNVYRKSQYQLIDGQIRNYTFSFQNQLVSWDHRYTQIIFNHTIGSVFIINYGNISSKWLMLFGKIDWLDEQNRIILMPIVSKSNIFQLTNQIIYVNYSFCLCGRIIYLYWPIQFNFKQFVYHQLLQITYYPHLVNKMIRIQLYEDWSCDWQLLQVAQNQQQLSRIRYGCTSWPINDNSFYIFGGIPLNQKYLQIPQSINIMYIQYNNYKIQRIYNNQIPLKIHYTISPISDTVIYLKGGYSTPCANSHHLFTTDSYLFDICKQEVTYIELSQLQLITLNRPLRNQIVGSFPIITQSDKGQQLKVCFSENAINHYCFESQSNIINFFDQNDVIYKDKYLFSNKILIDLGKYYYWKNGCLQLFFLDNQYTLIMLQLQFNLNVNISTSSQIVALTYHHSYLYILMEISSTNYSLYEANLNCQDHRIALIFKYNFNSLFYLTNKSLYYNGYNFYILGGQLTNIQYQNRIDYIITPYHESYQISSRTISSQDINVAVSFKPYFMRQGDRLLMYSIVNSKQTDWKIRIQGLSQKNNYIHQRSISVYSYIFDTFSTIKIVVKFKSPKFVKIIPYVKFNLTFFKQKIQKIINQFSEIAQKQAEINSVVKDLQNLSHFQTIETLKASIMECNSIFITMFQAIGSLQQDKKSYLKYAINCCWNLLNSLLLETILCHKQYPTQKQYYYIIEDSNSMKVKYIAIGNLNDTKLNFYKIRYKNEIITCLNTFEQQYIFFHANKSCQLQFSSKFYKLDKSIIQQQDLTQYKYPLIIKQLY